MDDLKNINQIAIDILKIAEDLSNKKPLNVDMLYRTAIKKLNYPDIEINKTIYDLLLKKIIIPEKKLVRTQVLKNEKRQSIFDLIRKCPGSHLREIRETLNLNPHVAQAHLKMLENFNFIYRRKHLKYIVFFPFDFIKKNEDAILSLKNDKAEQIFLRILQEQVIDMIRLKELEGIEQKLINYHLDPMVASGLISKVDKDGKTLYQVNQDKYLMIERYLEIKLEKIEGIKSEKPASADLMQSGSSDLLKPQVPQEPKDLVQIKREYDFVGGEIRFKCAVQNISNTVVTDINVTLIPTSQYEVTERVKAVEILKPGESRGVDFNLVPLTCGKSKVFGSATYMDPFGNPHTVTLQPKEIWIKCPLVIPKTTDLAEIDKIKKQLQKGEAKIHFEISQDSAFTIVYDQISALDLSEIDIDADNLSTIHSGMAKVTNDNMIIESKITNNIAVLTVWTRDMKQATGFLAYIKNLIKMTFELHKRMEGKIEKISQTILDTDDIFNRFATLFQYCEEKDNWKVGDIILLLNEIKVKVERSVPGSSIIEKIMDWNENLQALRVGDSLSNQNQMDLEHNIINWLSETNRVGCNQLEIYRQSFPEKKDQIKNLCELTEKEDVFVQKIHHIYAINILQYLMIINRKSGLAIFQYDFTKGDEIDGDLISGFLTAIQDFGKEISRGEDTSMKKLAYKNFQIELDDGEFTKIALILKGKPIKYLNKKLKTFIREFETTFKTELQNFNGDVAVFDPAVDLVTKTFQ
ncbi:MAG: hypothetical protein EAX96_05290 [Candidatus Lokiarchaeota archaeon]|nr:hypothetical protein [Candidatus Lokiarchaeota archaeon]